MDEPRAHLVYLRSGGVLLVKRPGADWRALQDEIDGYMTSLGPWTAEEVAGHFALDYGDDDARWPLTRRAIADFMASPGSTVLEA
jgi:hypothetical protein